MSKSLSTARTVRPAFSAVAAISEVGDRRCAMQPAVREQQLHLEGAVLDRGCQVLQRHERQRGSVDLAAGLVAAAEGVADFQPRHRADAHQPALDPHEPLFDVGRDRETRIGGLIDQPTDGHAGSRPGAAHDCVIEQIAGRSRSASEICQRDGSLSRRRGVLLKPPTQILVTRQPLGGGLLVDAQDGIGGKTANQDVRHADTSSISISRYHQSRCPGTSVFRASLDVPAHGSRPRGRWSRRTSRPTGRTSRAGPRRAGG
jgi:hypothetical protein